jgi:hypothetical protein
LSIRLDLARESIETERSVTEAVVPQLLTSFVQRLGFALGLVFGVALLGALALANAPDVVLMWHDDRGRLFVGIKRTETQRRLEQVEEKLNKIKHRHPSSLYSYTRWIDASSFLYLRARPHRRGRVLTEISPDARDILSSCKLEVTDDEVFVEVSYDGQTGWVNGWALSRAR